MIELLHNENDIIRSIAINICYDLSQSVWDEITDEVILLLKDKNIHIVKYALKIIATYPYEKNCLIPFSYLNHKDQEIRITAMELFDSYSLSTLKYMSEYFFYTNNLMYQEYISFLISSDKIDESEITQLMNSDNIIKQKLAIIIACKYPSKFKYLIQQDFKDDDIRRYILEKT